MAKHILTKSTFLRGAICPKSLWLTEHRPHLVPPTSAETQFIYDQGDKMGLLARQLFPDGEDASPLTRCDYQKAIKLTQALIAGGSRVIYEAAFQFDGVYSVLDILVYDDGWHAYECKSATKVHDMYLTDAALQNWVIEHCGIKLSSFSIIHLDSDYERQGEIEVDKLFKTEPVTYLVQALQDEITEQVAILKKVATRKTVPKVKIGTQCPTPYTCIFKPHCFARVPEETILDFTLYRKEERFRLYHSGIKKIADVKNWRNLKPPYNYVVEAHINKGFYLDPDKLRDFMDKLKFPLHFMDFETVSFALPQFNRSSPYDTMSFQYSLHTLESHDAEPEHSAYLADPSNDFREDFIKALLADLGRTGQILVWSIGFERSKLNMLSLLYPKYEDRINAVIERLVDLAIPFQKKWVYDNSLSCSYSIKNVLPLVAPDLSYDVLSVKNGLYASQLFQHMMVEPGKEWTKERADLLEYCCLDTYSMVMVYRFLLIQA